MITVNPLSSQSESVFVQVKKIVTDSKVQVKLLGLGIGVGSTLEVLRNRSGDMVLANNNIRISIGRSIANHIMVSESAGGSHG